VFIGQLPYGILELVLNSMVHPHYMSIALCYNTKRHAAHFGGSALRAPQLADHPGKRCNDGLRTSNEQTPRPTEHPHCPRAKLPAQQISMQLFSRTTARVECASMLRMVADRDRSCDHSTASNAPMASRARRRSLVLQCCHMLAFFFVPAEPQLAAVGRCMPGAARNVAQGDDDDKGARSPNPKPATADMIVPSPTSHGDGVMLQRAPMPRSRVGLPIRN
jgi:hypothetical protein